MSLGFPCDQDPMALSDSQLEQRAAALAYQKPEPQDALKVALLKALREMAERRKN